MWYNLFRFDKKVKQEKHRIRQDIVVIKYQRRINTAYFFWEGKSKSVELEKDESTDSEKAFCHHVYTPF